MKPIFLIGYMGAGKTTLGRVLARKLGCDFIDLDIFIENRFHRSVRNLFETKGEDGFRKIERNVLLEVAEFQDVVIACGGGTPCFFDNMALMREHGFTVWLTAPEPVLFARLTLPHAKAKRPSIATKSDEEIMGFIHDNIESRRPYYSQAEIEFDTTLIEKAAETEVTADRLITILQSYI